MRGVGKTLLVLGAVLACQQAVAGEDAPEDNLVTVRGETFAETVLKSDEMWGVVVLAPDEQCGEPCGKAKEVLGKLAGKMGHLMKFGTMLYSESIPNPAEDGQVQTVGEIFNIVNTTSGQATIPHLLIWQYGPKLTNMAISMPAQFLSSIIARGPKPAWKQLRNFLPSMAETVNSNKLPEWLSAKAPKLPRVLLFTEKLGASVLYKKLSMDFAGRGVFGEVSKYLEDMAEAFGVTEYPTLLVSRPGPLNPEDASDLKTWKRFKGDLNYDALKAFLSKNIPDRSTPLVHSPATWKSLCEDADGICLIAAVEEDAVARKRQMDTFNTVAHRPYVKVDMEGFQRGSVTAQMHPVSFMFIDGDRQADFRKVFDVAAAPAVVAVNPRKQVYTPMMGSFNERNIEEFVLGMVMPGEGVTLKNYAAAPHINTIVPTEALGGGKKKRRVKKVKKVRKKKAAPPAGDDAKAEL